MQKGDAPAAGAQTRGVIDEAVTGGATTGQRRVEIRDAIADVGDPGPAPGEKLGDGARGADRLEQLDVHVAESPTDDTRAIHRLVPAGNQTENDPHTWQGLGEARDSDAETGTPL